MLTTVGFWQALFVAVGLALLLVAALGWWYSTRFHKVVLGAFFIGLGYFLPLLLHAFS
jgi:DNA-binding transcriptional regulator of glucitol operon